MLIIAITLTVFWGLISLAVTLAALTEAASHWEHDDKLAAAVAFLLMVAWVATAIAIPVDAWHMAATSP